MDLRKMIAELQAEKQRLDEAIVALERLSASKMRGRAKHDLAPPSSSEEDLHEMDGDENAEEDLSQETVSPN